MMNLTWVGVCTECNTEQEVTGSFDNPNFCYDCRSVDTIVEIEDEE